MVHILGNHKNTRADAFNANPGHPDLDNADWSQLEARLAAEQAKTYSVPTAQSNEPVARTARSGSRSLTRDEARAKLAARGVPEFRLAALFSRGVERHYQRGRIEVRG